MVLFPAPAGPSMATMILRCGYGRLDAVLVRAHPRFFDALPGGRGKSVAGSVARFGGCGQSRLAARAHVGAGEAGAPGGRPRRRFCRRFAGAGVAVAQTPRRGRLGLAQVAAVRMSAILLAVAVGRSRCRCRFWMRRRPSAPKSRDARCHRFARRRGSTRLLEALDAGLRSRECSRLAAEVRLRWPRLFLGLGGDPGRWSRPVCALRKALPPAPALRHRRGGLVRHRSRVRRSAGIRSRPAWTSWNTRPRKPKRERRTQAVCRPRKSAARGPSRWCAPAASRAARAALRAPCCAPSAAPGTAPPLPWWR